MAKKSVSKLQKGDKKNMTRVIKMIRSSKTGFYTFKEAILPKDKAKDFFK